MVGLTFFLQSKSYILFSDVNLKSYSGSLSSFVRGFIVPSIIMDPAEPNAGNFTILYPVAASFTNSSFSSLQIINVFSGLYNMGASVNSFSSRIKALRLVWGFTEITWIYDAFHAFFRLSALIRAIVSVSYVRTATVTLFVICRSEVCA